jgi:hypothetical protein
VAGSGYRVQVENLQEFARKVRGLLAEFESGAGGDKTHAGSGVSASSFGSFAEAQRLNEKYAVMRDSLRDVLDILYQSMDEAQRNADATARNYDEQEQGTTAAMSGTATASAPTPSRTPARSTVEESEKW